MKASTKGEGHERRYFYGSVWAVCWAQPALWLMWKRRSARRGSATPSSWSFSSAFSHSSATWPAWAGCRGRARSSPANLPSRTDARMDVARRLGRLGRLRAVLRLGERADARPARHAVLAPRRARAARAGPRTRMRHRTHLAAARQGRRHAGRHRSVGADACAIARRRREARCGPDRRTANSPSPVPVRARRHPARCRSPGAHSARSSRRTASCSRCWPIAIWRRRSKRSRACSGPAARSASIWCPTCRTGASIRTACSLRGPRRVAVHLTLIESVRQDRVRRLTTFEQRYIERRNGRSRSTVRAGVPHAVGQTDDGPAESRRLCRRSRARRLSRPPVGRAGGCLDHPRKKEVEFFVTILRSSECPAIPSGLRSSTRRARSTPSAAGSSRASSRN